MIERYSSQPEKSITILQEIENVVEQSPEKVEAEFLRTANTWLDCFISRLFALETYLSIESAKEEMGSEKDYQRILGRLEELKEKIDILKEQYPTQDTIPPDEIKEELFQDLKNII